MSNRTTTRGRYYAVCDTCGRRTRKTFPAPVGLRALFDLPAGWSIAPYPAAFEHANGTHGSQHDCPICSRWPDRARALSGAKS